MANDGTVKIGTELDDSGFKSGLSKLGSVAKKSLAGVTAGVGAASAAIGLLTNKSLDAYASYEQLVGGVETLFKDSASTIQEYAENAYKTAGVSANSYMEQATAFSASLIQSLGGDTKAAAEYANQAIMDMSDNANKMGTDIETIQQTYQSLMRGNYEMLDNLKLGYGGTKAELERLVADAEKLTGKALDPTKFSDVITAINAIQTELGITGTTALEASTTIEGSVNSAKAAWENLIAGIANENADLETLIDNFVSSAATAAENILPRLTQILTGFGSTIQQLAPVISEQIPVIVSQIIPSLGNAAAQLIAGLISGLVTAAPSLVSAVPQIIGTLVSSLMSAAPEMVVAGSELLSMLTNGITQGIPYLAEKIPEVISSFISFIDENLPQILDTGVSILNSLVDGIIRAIPILAENLPALIITITDFIANNAGEIVMSGISIVMNLIEGIIKSIPNLVSAIPQLIEAMVKAFTVQIRAFLDIGKAIVEGIWEGISSMVSWIGNKISGFVGGIVNDVKGVLGISSPSKVFRDEVGQNIGLGVAKGIEISGKDAQYAMEKMAKDLEIFMPSASAKVSFANSAMAPASSPAFSTEVAIANAANMMAMARLGGSDRPFVIELNGREVARGIIPDIRAVQKQTPEIAFN